MKKNKFWKVTEKNYETVYDRVMRTLHHMADICGGYTTTAYVNYVGKPYFVLTEEKRGKGPNKYCFESDEFEAIGTNAFIRLKFEDQFTYVTIDIKQGVRIRILSDRIIVKMANTTLTISVKRLIYACKGIPDQIKQWIINDEHLTEVPLSELNLPDSKELYDDIMMNIGIDVDDEDYEYPSIKAVCNLPLHQQQEPDKDALIAKLFEEPTNGVLDSDTGVPIELIEYAEFEQQSEDVPFETMLIKADVPNKNMSIIPASKAEEVFKEKYGNGTKSPEDVILEVYESQVEDKNLKVMYSTDDDIPDPIVVSQSFADKLMSKESRMVNGKVEIRDIELETGDKISGRYGEKE